MQWFFFIVLSIICIVVAGGNAAGTLGALATRRGYSVVPLIGGLSGTLALVISPLPGWRDWWWVPLVADVGTGWLTAACSIAACVWVARRLKGN